MNNPLSAYDFVYKAMTDEERNKQLEELVEFNNRMRENRY